MLFSIFRSILLLCVSALFSQGAAPLQTQTLTLPVGWSLVSIQVNNAPTQVFLSRN